jgi:phage shock protein C
MNISDELTKLAELHQTGKLNDEEFARAKAALLYTADSLAPAPLLAGINTLRRGRNGRWVGGVCTGLASATKVESWVWRLLFVSLAIFGGVSLIIYILMWIFVPEE